MDTAQMDPGPRTPDLNHDTSAHTSISLTSSWLLLQAPYRHQLASGRVQGRDETCQTDLRQRNHAIKDYDDEDTPLHIAITWTQEASIQQNANRMPRSKMGTSKW
ncbi:hypothetical protein NDU88_005615 [Pleurodeles waltl]|uniref:Uncharacterized protein n=1 Tax=Pleurodeles waltl TaxID=8319 RepID=A0AAV7VM90_PLEWA|nr:hypothetical protein NDU88_005615 [Pleurodeles waltl]